MCSAQPKPLVHIFSGPLYKQTVKNHLCSSYLNVIYLPINNSCVNNELMSTSAWVCQIQDLQRVAQYLSVVHLVSLLHLKWTNNCTQSSFPQLSRLFGREFVGLRVIPTSNVCHQAWNFISEKARPTLICKGRLPWKILKFIGRENRVVRALHNSRDQLLYVPTEGQKHHGLVYLTNFYQGLRNYFIGKCKGPPRPRPGQQRSWPSRPPCSMLFWSKFCVLC